MNCGVGHRWGSHPTLLWLWCRPAAVALIWLLTWEPLYAMSAALKRQKKRMWITFQMPNTVSVAIGRSISLYFFLVQISFDLYVLSSLMFASFFSGFIEASSLVLVTSSQGRHVKFAWMSYNTILNFSSAGWKYLIQLFCLWYLELNAIKTWQMLNKFTNNHIFKCYSLPVPLSPREEFESLLTIYNFFLYFWFRNIPSQEFPGGSTG